MLYTAYEMSRNALRPWRAAAQAGADFWQSPYNLAKDSWLGRNASASLAVFDSITRHYTKPDWRLDFTEIKGKSVPVSVETVLTKDFGSLLHFRREPAALKKAKGARAAPDPRVLIVAPMSGHFATLLRGTVEAMLPEHEVYITDWADARNVPITSGTFDLNNYVDYLIDFLSEIGSGAHTMAVCQPGPALLAAIAVMSEQDHPDLPATMTFMGSPIDARKSPTVTNQLAEQRSFEWFESNMIQTVPAPYAGIFRRVYPGFLQLFSFMSMNSERHMQAHHDYFNHLVEGDGDSAEKHRKFYDEYLSVCDMTAEFYLQTIREVFQEYTLAQGNFRHHGNLVEPGNITKVGLMTVEGELDDISGIGQTQAAHTICSGIPDDMKLDYIQPGVGHYGVFNGSRWRTEIQPRLRTFIMQHHNAANEKKVQSEQTASHLKLVKSD
ncbi:MAG: polyhydroxyalkanoate depolymerase [Aquisalinus sp.]|nr:polyhydroxyalkanoate depolymerase [Aquisalinus sp.]